MGPLLSAVCTHRMYAIVSLYSWQTRFSQSLVYVWMMGSAIILHATIEMRLCMLWGRIREIQQQQRQVPSKFLFYDRDYEDHTSAPLHACIDVHIIIAIVAAHTNARPTMCDTEEARKI